MILGTVGTGMVVGLAAAMMAWAGGHSPAMALLIYSVTGSFGTLFLASVAAVRNTDFDGFHR